MPSSHSSLRSYASAARSASSSSSSADDASSDPDTQPYQVLLTGFGPFGPYTANPSWEAVKPLHGRVLPPPLVSSDLPYADQISPKRLKPIYIQTVNLPVVYSSTLAVVPRLHGVLDTKSIPSPYASRRPIVDGRGPQDGSQGNGIRHYPEGFLPRIRHPRRGGYGYDLIIHVGAGADGAIKVERQAHKKGYWARDEFGEDPPPLKAPREDDDEDDLVVSSRGGQAKKTTSYSSSSSKLWKSVLYLLTLTPRLISSLLSQSTSLLARLLAISLPSEIARPVVSTLRNLSAKGGFGPGYEQFSSTLRSDIDVQGLVQHLQSLSNSSVSSSHSRNARAEKAKSHAENHEDEDEEGEEDGEALTGPIILSSDPGRFLCDFTYYCSLAEAERAYQKRDSASSSSSTRTLTTTTRARRKTDVLFMHVPPPGMPQTVDQDREVILRAVQWCCWGLSQ